MFCIVLLRCKKNKKLKGTPYCQQSNMTLFHTDPALNLQSSGSRSNPYYLSIFGNCFKKHLKSIKKQYLPTGWHFLFLKTVHMQSRIHSPKVGNPIFTYLLFNFQLDPEQLDREQGSGRDIGQGAGQQETGIRRS